MTALKINPQGAKPAMLFVLSCQAPAYYHEVSRVTLNQVAELMTTRKKTELTNVFGNANFSKSGMSKIPFETLFKQLSSVTKANGVELYNSRIGSSPNDMADINKLAEAGPKILAHLKDI